MVEIDACLEKHEESQGQERQGRALDLDERVDSLHPSEQLFHELQGDIQDESDEAAEHSKNNQNDLDMLLDQVEVNCFVLLPDCVIAPLVEVVALHPRCGASVEKGEPEGGKQEDVDHDYSEVHVNDHKAEPVVGWQS